MSDKYILVTGGAGFIGSHVTKMLGARGYHPIILDNLSHGNEKSVIAGTFIKGDLSHDADLEKIFNTFSISAVMHFAAFIDVGESVINPAKYYLNNVFNTCLLLEKMRKYHVNILIFSSSAAIFGYPNNPNPINETHPYRPINPYGQTKLAVENILKDYSNAYGLKFSCLRYFNAAGGDPEGKIKNYKQKETNLIPQILNSVKTPGKQLKIFGTDYPTSDGTCVRDYIHIEDLGSAHIITLEKLLNGGDSTHYNLGNGNGFTIRQVIETVEIVTNQKVNFIETARRPGDPPILIADSSKACRELGWHPEFSDLKTIISHAWEALKN